MEHQCQTANEINDNECDLPPHMLKIGGPPPGRLAEPVSYELRPPKLSVCHMSLTSEWLHSDQ